MLIFIKLLGKVLVLLPEAVPRTMAKLLGDLIFYLPTKRRHNLLSNIHHCFPERDRAWRENIARQSCRRMIEMGLFVLASPHMSLAQLKKRFALDPAFAKRIAENARDSHPAVLLVPHFSMMEALNMLPGMVEGDMQHCGVIYRPLKQKAIEQWVLDTRQRFGCELLSRKKGFKRAREILRQCGVVAVLFDQNAGSSGILTTFFGRICSASELPGLLAQKFNGLIGSVYTKHTGFWRGTITLEEHTRPEHSEEVVFLAHDWLEKRLQEDENICADWLWLHERWRHQDHPTLRFQLQSRRNHLQETCKYHAWKTLPRKTRIWIRMPNWLGDVIMAIPLIRALRKGRPDAEITLLAQNHFLPLLQELKVAERLIAIPRKGSGGYFSFFKKLAHDYPDVQVLLTNSTRGDLEARYIKAPQRFGIARPGKRRKLLTHTWQLPHDLDEAQLHQTRLWERFFQHFGLDTPLELQPLPLSAQTDSPANGPVGLIPSTENEPAKRWPVAHWREFIGAIPEQDFVCFGTPRDVEICNAVADGFGHRVKNRAGKTDLLEFARELTQCRVVVCNDTGGMHLANMLGVPVIVIYGPTNPIRTGPVFDAPSVNIQPDGCPSTGGRDIEGVEVNSVLEALNSVHQ